MHALQPGPVPLVLADDGVIRVPGTRVTLDVILAAFAAGATAEEIVQQYTTLDLPTTYAVLTWALQHEDEVREYRERRDAEAERVRAENERRFPPEGIRARLLARRTS
ncbi:MAG: DUF433 domain-containing protein [Deltaproteobacteria bacterium]|nr:DUF433 domain-containing protein [Deltaproteobacteria bacterium]